VFNVQIYFIAKKNYRNRHQFTITSQLASIQQELVADAAGQVKVEEETEVHLTPTLMQLLLGGAQ
jgi:hypothetical protein